MRNAVRGVAFLAVLATIAGCGFQLRGAMTPPAAMATTWIETQARHSPFYVELRRQLLDAGIDLSASAEAASAILTISVDDTDQRVLSVSARNVPTEYEVYYTVEYAITSGAETLLASRRLTLTRDYTYDSTLVLGKAREEDALRKAIVDDLVQVVLRQIDAL